MATTKLMTADELERLEDDGYRYGLTDGELIRMAPGSRRHGRIELIFAVHLYSFVSERKLGEVYGAETGFVLVRNPDVVLGPDVSFVRAERLPANDEGFLAVVPDLAVEVISPSERAGPLRRKVQKYLDAGVPMLVLVDARRRTVTVHAAGRDPVVLREGDELDGGEVLPGFRLPVATLFAT